MFQRQPKPSWPASAKQQTAALRLKHLSSTRTPFARTLPMLGCCCADGRAYVSFGKLLVRQRRFGEAEQLYQDGCRMTENINPHIWQVGAMPDVDARTAFVMRSGRLCLLEASHIPGRQSCHVPQRHRYRTSWLRSRRCTSQQPGIPIIAPGCLTCHMCLVGCI